MTMTKSVVTGLGLMSGLGLDTETSWRGLISGRTPARRFTIFDPEGLDCTFGVELPDGADSLFADAIKPRSRRQMTRGTMITVVTAAMAIEDAALDLAAMDRGRIGVVIGATGTGYAPPAGTRDEHRILRNMASSPATWVSLKNKLAGPAFVVGTACSSGAYALDAAHALLTSGRCDVVITGAADSTINYPDVEGFCSLMALAQGHKDPASASRPFEKSRSGFVIGEGGGILVLETPESATRRGAHVYAETAGAGLCSEAYNILSPRPGGAGMAESMRLALQAATLEPADIDYVNAHGTSTALNDLYETQAIREVFADHATSLAVSSTKSMTGHCLAGAAGVEAAICCKALEEGIVPPTMNFSAADPELDLDYVPNAAREKPLRHVMSNSFAFGGHNGVNIFSRPA